MKFKKNILCLLIMTAIVTLGCATNQSKRDMLIFADIGIQKRKIYKGNCEG